MTSAGGNEHRTPDARTGPDAGDAWVEGPNGERYWGKFGAAGLLAVDHLRGVLLQHRAQWSHHGGTWGIPGGALHQNEPAVAAALREAWEEAGVPTAAMHLRATWRIDRGVWSYTTVVADVLDPFEPYVGDTESIEVRWVAVDEVNGLHLHPAFAQAWPSLRRGILSRPHLVIDAANVVGAVPDGWWRDRQAAAQRLVGRLDHMKTGGIPAAALGLEGDTWFPGVDVIVEGAARGVEPVPKVTVINAPSAGDDAIVGRVHELVTGGASPVVVTSDAELRHRVERAGAKVFGARWLLDHLARVAPDADPT